MRHSLYAKCVIKVRTTQLTLELAVSHANEHQTPLRNNLKMYIFMVGNSHVHVAWHYFQTQEMQGKSLLFHYNPKIGFIKGIVVFFKPPKIFTFQ